MSAQRYENIRLALAWRLYDANGDAFRRLMPDAPEKRAVVGVATATYEELLEAAQALMEPIVEP